MGDENNISNEEKIASILNKYFINQTKSLNFKKQISLRNGDRTTLTVTLALKITPKKHPETVTESFRFDLVTHNDVKGK